VREVPISHGGVDRSTGPRKHYEAARKSPIFDAAASDANIEQSSVVSRNSRWLRAPDLNLRVIRRGS
jgi:hypothetical protein